MVDTYGRWTEETDYSIYPQYKWCDYDYMAVWIRSKNYTPKTTMENLIEMIFAHYDSEIETGDSKYDWYLPDKEGIYTESCKEYVEDNGGLEEFDYYC